MNNNIVVGYCEDGNYFSEIIGSSHWSIYVTSVYHTLSYIGNIKYYKFYYSLYSSKSVIRKSISGSFNIDANFFTSQVEVLLTKIDYTTFVFMCNTELLHSTDASSFLNKKMIDVLIYINDADFLSKLWAIHDFNKKGSFAFQIGETLYHSDDIADNIKVNTKFIINKNYINTPSIMYKEKDVMMKQEVSRRSYVENNTLYAPYVNTVDKLIDEKVFEICLNNSRKNTLTILGKLLYNKYNFLNVTNIILRKLCLK